MSISIQLALLTGLFFSLSITAEPPVEETYTFTFQDNGIHLSASGSHTIQKLREHSRLFLKPGSESEISSSQTIGELISLRVNLLGGSLFFTFRDDEINEAEVMTPNAFASFSGESAGFTSTGFYWVEEGSLEIMAMRSGQSISIRNGMFAQIDPEGNDVVTGQLSPDEIRQLRIEHTEPASGSASARFILEFDADGKDVIRRNNIQSAEN